ncbi:hypothetical protein EWM64_g9038 [Hericium alpestre]|uniref:Uncharacterized protein n=1 Tax=Hericium alpestre TaxID=135208 RepID=A0A4Y9ZKJ6_9AGAM|nr:hypothetical protein EWM64_g9038 [Hericium alpestre]
MGDVHGCSSILGQRQRKHRALVKQRKLRELGLDMGNDIIPGMEDVQYRVQNDGQYHPVLQPDMSQGPMGPHNEPPFPQGQLVGGQTFASTLLLSFSCAPLLKQHLLRTLSMTNEELASLEPIIAQAWEQWDHQRRMHYAQQAQVAAANSVKPPEPHQLAEASSSAYTNVDMTDHTGGYPDPNQASPNDFRARFHRPLVAPSPFRNFATDARTTATTSTPTSTASVQGQDTIDPHLAAAMAEAGDPRRTIDPELGQARGEAEGVVGRLER